jgi:hypothetical protein
MMRAVDSNAAHANHNSFTRSTGVRALACVHFERRVEVELA